jgi:hypothetical protein
MADLPLDIGKHLPGIGLIPAPVQVLGCNTKLDNEIAREVFGFDFTPLFAPQPGRAASSVPIMIGASDPPMKWRRSPGFFHKCDLTAFFSNQNRFF